MRSAEGLIYVDSDELLDGVVEASPINDLSLAANAVLKDEPLFPFSHGNYLSGVGLARQLAMDSVVIHGKEHRAVVRQLGITTPQGPVLMETLVGWGEPENLSSKKRKTSFLGWVRSDRLGSEVSYSEWHGMQTDKKKRHSQWQEGELKKQYQPGTVTASEQWVMTVLEAVHTGQETLRRGTHG